MSKSQDADVTRHPAYSFIRTNINYIKNLPKPGTEWTVKDVGLGVRARKKACQKHGVIMQKERADLSAVRFYYETDRRAYRDIQHVLDMFELSPCGHTGVQNLGGGEYSCGYEFCSGVFGREDALRMLE